MPEILKSPDGYNVLLMPGAVVDSELFPILWLLSEVYRVNDWDHICSVSQFSFHAN